MEAAAGGFSAHHFDTYKQPDCVEGLVALVEGLPEGARVLLAVRDEGTRGWVR